MTIEKFIEKIEGYYGEYNDVMRSVVVGFLETHYPSLGMRGMALLFTEVVKTFTAQYKSQPDVAIMRPMVLRIMEETEHDFLIAATRGLLPDPSECVEPEDGKRFMKLVFECIENKQDPRDNDEFQSLLEKYGVTDDRNQYQT